MNRLAVKDTGRRRTYPVRGRRKAREGRTLWEAEARL